MDEKPIYNEAKYNPKAAEKVVTLPKTFADIQRHKVEKLMKNPDKKVFIPEPKKQWKPKTAPEFVRDVMGSSAGAGSGEFHVYRHIRRREYDRQAFLSSQEKRLKLDEEHELKQEENKKKAEEKTRKKREKRLRKKQAKKLNAKKNKNKKKEESNSDSAEEVEDNSEEEKEKNSDAEK